MNFQKIPKIWFFLSGIVFLVGFVACFLFAPSQFTLGYTAGGALVLVNAWLSAWRIKKSDFFNKGRAVVSLLGGFYFRLIFLGLCLFVLIKFTKVDPVGLVTGLSVVPAGLFVMLTLIYISNRRPEEV
ncbi:MAG: ATP synthase subunit I [Deltaproteobacteria bacterium]|nr:ATP synthase subunit I [Deltaproteobacteria bacterium]